jgi:uncharacterized protein YhhL (DUF1145 family)
MNQTQIKVGKRFLEVYWLAVIVAAVFFTTTTIGYYLAIGGAFILFAHFVEIFVFSKIIKKHSDNVLFDSLKVIPYGLLVPNELKLKA